MRASRLLSLSVLMFVMTAVWVGGAVARASPHHAVTRAQKSVGSRSRPVAPKTRKASSFAPHPTKRRVFGAPIQPPIVHKPPAPKTLAAGRPK